MGNADANDARRDDKADTIPEDRVEVYRQQIHDYEERSKPMAITSEKEMASGGLKV
jgi:hypothetical protein